MRISRLWPVFVFSLPTIGLGAVPFPHATRIVRGTELRLFRLAISESQFSEVERNSFRSRCRDSRPPEALATSTPLLAEEDEGKLVVSFIVGADGRVYSALILEGKDTLEFRVVLNAVRRWRFRPATCNGVPMDVEDRIQFSRQ